MNKSSYCQRSEFDYLKVGINEKLLVKDKRNRNLIFKAVPDKVCDKQDKSDDEGDNILKKKKIEG